MSTHDKNMLAASTAIALANEHFRKKEGGDAMEIISRKLSDHTEVVTEHLKKSGESVSALEARAAEVEQIVAGLGSGRGFSPQPMTWGKQLIDEREAELSALSSTSKGVVELNVKNTLVNEPGSAESFDDPDRDEMVNVLPRRRMTMRNLLQVVRMSSGSVEYVNQTGRANNAAAVPEGDLKPESDFTFSLETASTKVIAHFIKASRQILDDAPQLKDVIDTEMLYGLALAEEAQILSGDGTGANLTGLITSATAFADPLGATDPTMIDVVGASILQSALAEFPPTGVVLHPADWWKCRLAKDADGNYILGNPQAETSPRLFGLPVVATQAMVVGEFLVGDFTSAATLYDRWQPRIEVGYADDDFKRNLVTILAEERLALAIKQGNALTYGNFVTTP